jgi:hypothetical protein
VVKNRWGDAGLTIVLLPSGAQGEGLLGVAKYWTEMKLLSQAVWIRPEFLASGSQKPPKQKALVLGTDSEGKPLEIEVDLFEQLARQQLLTVRLLVVRSVSDNLEFDEAQDRLAQLLEQYLTVALPLPVSAGYNREKYTQFLRMNLVTAPTEFESADGARLISSKFNVNFIAAAEDRSAPLAGDAFVRDEPASKRFSAFTMMHVATIGALWVGLPVGLYELLNPSGATGSQVYISRTFISAILTAGLARRASARVLRKIADPQAGAVDFTSELPVEGTYQIPDGDQDKFIESMVNLTFGFDDNKLSYRPSPEAERVRAAQHSMESQANSFFVFAWDKLISIPRHMVTASHRSVARLVNLALHGGDDTGYSSVKMPKEYFDVRDTVIIENRQKIAVQKERADMALVSPVTPSDVRSTPVLWEDMRKLVFGMLDGSNLEKFGYPKSENGWPIFYRVSDLFADPAVSLTNDGDSSQDGVSWSQSGASLTTLRDLSQHIVAEKALMESALRDVVESNTQLEEIGARIEELEMFLAEDSEISPAENLSGGS